MNFSFFLGVDKKLLLDDTWTKHFCLSKSFLTLWTEYLINKSSANHIDFHVNRMFPPENGLWQKHKLETELSERVKELESIRTQLGRLEDEQTKKEQTQKKKQNDERVKANEEKVRHIITGIAGCNRNCRLQQELHVIL